MHLCLRFLRLLRGGSAQRWTHWIKFNINKVSLKNINFSSPHKEGSLVDITSAIPIPILMLFIVPRILKQ
jgi:hypothetical protein